MNNNRLGISGSSIASILIYILLTLQSLYFCVYAYYNNEVEKRYEFIRQVGIEQEKKSTSDVLSLLVPEFI